MVSQSLQFVVRTPREVVLQLDVQSVRVPTETGQVGVRTRAEPFVLAVEPGLVLVRAANSLSFAGTAGGLLRCDGHMASLLTPLAVVGTDETDVLLSLEDELQQPNAESEARAALERLQSSILRELRQSRKQDPQRIGDDR